MPVRLTLMPPTAISPTEIVAYLALFATVGFLFVLASLFLGWFLRSRSPSPLKQEIYECGEPAIGSGAVQFDLRFYVVALLFLIFEVEVAFFFPPATVFGTAIRAERIAIQAEKSQSQKIEKKIDTAAVRTVETQAGTEPQAGETTVVVGNPAAKAVRSRHKTLALVSMIDLGLFFAVLLVGFAFVWRRGDLDWVRAVRHPATPAETAALMARFQRGELPS